MLSAVWNFLTSIRLAIVLLILIILLSIAGSLIPQEQEPDFYQKYLPEISSLILFLEFHHLYRSPLFLSLVFLFLLNLLFCSLKQVPAKFRRLKTITGDHPPGRMYKLSPEDSLKIDKWLNREILSLESVLRKKGFRTKIIEESGQKFFLARKGLAGLFGPELVHLGLILIIMAGLISALFSQRITLALLEGQTEEIPDKNFALRLDRFTTEYYPDGQVKSWNSEVSVIENGQVRLQKTIRVNHPLKFGGLSFFQMGYGQDWDRASVELQVKLSEEKNIKIDIRTGESRTLEDGYRIRILSFLPDFQLEASGRVETRSTEPFNPAALIEITHNSEQVFLGWVFARQPERKDLQKRTRAEVEVRLVNFSAPTFSVLEASSDPGTGPVWTGCILMLLGLLTSFYLPYREIRIKQQFGSLPELYFYSRKQAENFQEELAVLLGLNKKTSKG